MPMDTTTATGIMATVKTEVALQSTLNVLQKLKSVSRLVLLSSSFYSEFVFSALLCAAAVGAGKDRAVIEGPPRLTAVAEV